MSDAGCASTRTYRVKNRLGIRVRCRYIYIYTLYLFHKHNLFQVWKRVSRNAIVYFRFTLFSSIYFILSVFLRMRRPPFVPSARYIPDIYQSDDRREQTRISSESRCENGQSKWPRMARLQARNLSGAGETGTSPREAQNESRKCNSKHWMEQWNRIVEWRLVQLTCGSLTSFCRSTTMKRELQWKTSTRYLVAWNGL